MYRNVISDISVNVARLTGVEVNLFVIFKIIGVALNVEAGLMLVPLLFAAYYGESIWCFLIPGIVGLCLGTVLWVISKGEQRVKVKEGFISAGLTWIVLSFVGMLPFMICGATANPFDAFFETVSGLTTTGATILKDIEAVPRSINIWRCFMHWIGGMGVLVFMSVFVRFSSGSQMNLIKAEISGAVVSKLVPRARDTAKILYGIYIGMTVILFIILLLLRMPVYDAVCATFSTAGTGGFMPLNSSAASYTLAQQLALGIGMFAFGMNFNFYFLLLLRRLDQAFRMEEIWLYFAIALGSGAIIAVDLMRQSGVITPLTVHNALFNVSSIMTSTGFAIDDINNWPHLSQCVIVCLMFIGACAGSTSCGYKISRLLIMGKAFMRDLAVQLHPDMVKKVHVDGKVVDENVIRAIGVYTYVYILIVIVSTLLMSIEGKDWMSTFTAVMATFNNTGPGIGINGSFGNYEAFSNFGKMVLSADMLIGRLEIFPILAIFSREAWRRF